MCRAHRVPQNQHRLPEDVSSRQAQPPTLAKPLVPPPAGRLQAGHVMWTLSTCPAGLHGTTRLSPS